MFRVLGAGCSGCWVLEVQGFKGAGVSVCCVLGAGCSGCWVLGVQGAGCWVFRCFMLGVQGAGCGEFRVFRVLGAGSSWCAW